MRRHRLLTETVMHHLPEPQPPDITPAAFCLCPLAVVAPMSVEQALLRQMIYQMAFAQAQAVVRPSLPERDLLAVWN